MLLLSRKNVNVRQCELKIGWDCTGFVSQEHMQEL